MWAGETELSHHEGTVCKENKLRRDVKDLKTVLRQNIHSRDQTKTKID